MFIFRKLSQVVKKKEVKKESRFAFCVCFVFALFLNFLKSF